MSETRSGPTLVFVAVSVAAIAGLLYYAAGVTPSEPEQAPLAGPRAGGTSAAGSQQGISASVGPSARDNAVPGESEPASPRAVEASASVAQAIADVRALYGYAGVLDTEEARALIAKRKAASAALVARLAAFGAASVGPIVDAYGSAKTGREKLMLISALAQNPSEAAASGLASLLEQEDTFSYRRAILEGLGESNAPNANEALLGASDAVTDPREQVSAIRAMGEGETTTASLVELAQGDQDVSVRVAAVVRLSELGGDSAPPVLNQIASEASGSSRVRAAAIQALTRTFPDQALDLLTRLQSDAEPRIRSAVVAALERLRSEEAVSLLRAMARDDADAAVRAMAEKALSRVAL